MYGVPYRCRQESGHGRVPAVLRGEAGIVDELGGEAAVQRCAAKPLQHCVAARTEETRDTPDEQVIAKNTTAACCP